MREPEKKYKYAEKAEQIKRSNRLVILGYATFYVFMLAVLWISCMKGMVSKGFSAGTSVFMLVSFATIMSVYKIDKKGEKLRYVSLVALLILTFLTAFVFDGYYIRFMAAIPFCASVVFFDKKYALISGGSYIVLNIVLNVLKINVLHIYTGEAVWDQIYTTGAIILMMVLIYMNTNITTIYNHDTRHSLMRQQEKQKMIMDEVLKLAEQVREGTENAMGMVNDLNSSTEMVKGAMQDISTSTQNTASNIQTQTSMTQNIQNSIGTTLERAGEMVRVAKQSSELNAQSLQIMQQLKKQSEVISETNSEVATSMQQLMERSKAVKSIADTIYSISSQTNLLALNASIESARAGEAGKGFAVVADEIRQLAEKTRLETEHIATILNELSNDAEQATGAVMKSVEAANAQDNMIANASESFEEVSTNVDRLISDIGEIDQMLEGLSSANNQIVDNIVQLSETTEEVTASSAQAAELSVQNLTNAENTKEQLDSVLAVAEQLKKYI